ncbi:unnamed protein product [Rotaria magnacalcarata]|uniref:Uncharacterized protein n=1 Tax=Rotaria magnacalcarata TaxID=392030 RepID=A0A815UM98_9BILA|nr:unnamed protein product [Rotaria magnacalcarata]CAF1657318.1 unnamed protein product [Rotaria magnacalcarata]
MQTDLTWIWDCRKEQFVLLLILLKILGIVFLDNGYYNKAITTSPVSALPGYILGGISWFAVPLLAATTMGLAAVSFDAFGHGLCMEQVVMCLPKGFFTVGINPLVEGRHSISSVTKRMFTDLMSYRRHNIEDVQTKDLTKEASPKLL